MRLWIISRNLAGFAFWSWGCWGGICRGGGTGGFWKRNVKTKGGGFGLS